MALLLDNFAFVINVIKSINSFNCDVSFSAVKQWQKREKNPTYSLKNNAFCSRITYLLPILVALFTNAMYCLQKKYFLNSVIHYKCFCVQSERTWCVNYSFLFIRKSRKRCVVAVTRRGAPFQYNIPLDRTQGFGNGNNLAFFSSTT